VKQNRTTAYAYGDFLTKLFGTQPEAALAVFYPDNDQDSWLGQIWHFGHHNKQPIDVVDRTVLLQWAQANPEVRFEKLAASVEIFVHEKDGPRPGLSWSPLMSQVMVLAPDREAVLARIAPRLSPSAWRGSKAEMLERYRLPLQELFNHADPVIARWARVQDQILQQEITEDWARERFRDERFE
jgi:hypothetical protein